jgi:hypothetical protein
MELRVILDRVPARHESFNLIRPSRGPRFLESSKADPRRREDPRKAASRAIGLSRNYGRHVSAFGGRKGMTAFHPYSKIGHPTTWLPWLVGP